MAEIAKNVPKNGHTLFSNLKVSITQPFSSIRSHQINKLVEQNWMVIYDFIFCHIIGCQTSKYPLVVGTCLIEKTKKVKSLSLIP